jgi:hypothetical protein
MAPLPASAVAVRPDSAVSWPAAPVEPVVHADPVAHAVQLLLTALWTSNADRIVLETGQLPSMVTGKHKSALMNYRPSLQGIQEIATYLFPLEYLEALEEIGATRIRLSGFTAEAAYDDSGLTIQITPIRR